MTRGLQGDPSPVDRFAIVANGFSDGPAEALRDFLVASGAGVTVVSHPLVPEGGRSHRIREYEAGALVRAREVSLPVGPPWSFAVDPLVPLRMPAVDVWFGFNCIACARGLVARRRGRARSVVYWCVDFVTERFGNGLRTRLYEGLDRLCAERADLRVELSEAARDARDARNRLDGKAAPVEIVPMGAWLDRAPHVASDGWRRKHVVFLGHLVRRQGVHVLLDAIALLRRSGVDVTATVIGGGPEEASLRTVALSLGIGDAVRFTGFVPSHRDVESLLATGSVGVAPYEPTPDSLTRQADPGKLKAYLAAGLPVVLTDVPPNARALAAHAGAEIVPFGAPALAASIERLLRDAGEWTRRHDAALEYARAFDWPRLLAPVLAATRR